MNWSDALILRFTTCNSENHAKLIGDLDRLPHK